MSGARRRHRGAALLRIRASTGLPRGLVPKIDRFDFGGLGAEVWFPLVTNVLCVGSIALTGVALLGRIVGTVAALIAYPVLFAFSASSLTPGPYSATCSTDTASAAWGPAFVLAFVAMAVWYRTGGSTRSARLLDPRH